MIWLSQFIPVLFDRLAELAEEGLDKRRAFMERVILGSRVGIFAFPGPMRPEKAPFRTNEGHASTGPAWEALLFTGRAY